MLVALILMYLVYDEGKAYEIMSIHA